VPDLPENAGLTAAGFSAAAIASPATVAATAQCGSDVENDVAIMQGALALEHEGIAAYQIAAGSGLLTPGTMKVALVLQPGTTTTPRLGRTWQYNHKRPIIGLGGMTAKTVARGRRLLPRANRGDYHVVDVGWPEGKE
jgi:hypothetical protein